MYMRFFWANQWSKFKACFAIISIDRMIIYAWPAIIAGDYCIKLLGELRFDYSTVSFAFICNCNINFHTCVCHVSCYYLFFAIVTTHDHATASNYFLLIILACCNGTITTFINAILLYYN